MKKLLVTLALAGTLSVPSVVFAEATWYGSLRGGLHSQSGGEGKFFDGGSRWGIKGSAEVGEGLNAVYRFEHKISTTDAGQPGGRLAYAGLSGGFGSVTVGQIWNAAYNHAGAITDKSYYFGNSTTGYRHGNALSYAHSAGPVSFQVDLISDGGMETGQGIDKTEFGVTVNVGEIGKVALAHTTVRDEAVTKMTDRVPGTPYVPEVINSPAVEAVEAVPEGPPTYRVNTAAANADAMYVDVTPIMVKVAQGDIASHLDTDGTKLIAAGLPEVTRDPDGTYRTGDVTGCAAAAEDQDTTNDCKDVTAYVYRRNASTSADVSGVDHTQDRTTVVRETFYAEAEEVAGTPAVDAVEAVEADITDAVPGKEEVAPMAAAETKAGHKNTHVAVEFNIGGMTPYVGYSVKKTNMGMKLDADMQLTADNEPNVVEDPATTTKTTHFGVSGGVGDTGVNFLVAARSVQTDSGAKTSPWLFNVSKNLGGGATVIFEHASDDDAMKTKKSRIGLHVTF